MEKLAKSLPKKRQLSQDNLTVGSRPSGEEELPACYSRWS
jgi:hypothetical protein